MAKSVMEASMAVALAAKMAGPGVVPMYPITPQTHIVEHLAKFISDGEMDAKAIEAESEHSACSMLIGASTAGARTFTATASQGLAYMFEVLPIVSGMRLPSVMAVANRALSGPINIWNDHSDSVSARDQGWIQFYVESAQEAFDTILQAFKLSEDKDILLPSMVCLDGFTLSHVWEPVDIPAQSKVDSFLPGFKPKNILDPKNPKSFGPIAFPDTFMGFKRQQHMAMKRALRKIKHINTEFAAKFGRRYGNGVIEEYRMDDANYAVMGMGTLCGTSRRVIDKLRAKGERVGMIRVRSLRPFPRTDIIRATAGLKGLAVIDRHTSLGAKGPLYMDLRSVLYAHNTMKVNGYIAGLGGRDIKMTHIRRCFRDLKEKKNGGWLM